MSTQPQPQPQMDVLYMETYGHVLGIFTRNAEPNPMEKIPDAFVGTDGFHLRGLITDPTTGLLDFVVPTNLIGILRLPLVPAALIAPLGYGAGPAANPTGVQTLLTPPITVTVAVSPFSVTVAAIPGSASGSVLILIGGQGTAATPIGPIPIPSGGVSVSATSPSPSPGTYWAVAFVPGSSIAVSTEFTV